MATDQRVILVTGAARRVGRAIAVRLGLGGSDIALHAHTSVAEAHKTAEEIAAGGRRCDVFTADLADGKQAGQLIARVAKAMGRVDGLVNNASIFDPDRPADGAEALAGLWQRMMAINATAPAVLSYSLAAHLEAVARTGRIVNIVDISAERPWSRYQAYCASKAALLSLTKSTAKAFAPRVAVNAVAPGTVLWSEQGDPDGRDADRAIKRIPMGRIGCPEDVAEATAFLLERGDYMTGQVLRVDGGRSVAF